MCSRVQAILSAREAELQREKHYTRVAPLFEVAARYGMPCKHWPVQAAESAAAAREDRVQVADWLQQGLLSAEQWPLLQRLLVMLAELGLAEVQAEGIWQLASDCDLPATQDIWLAILGDSPAHVAELVLLGRCGEQLPAVLRGAQTPAALLAPDKSSIREHWQDSAPTFRAVNLALAAWVEQALTQWPANRRIRILELGGGDAALTHRLLPLLPHERCDYVFTDPQLERVEQAQAEFEQVAGFSALQLDADLKGEAYAQLLAGPGFDWVLVGNALYPWSEPVQVLPRIRALLKAQAWLLSSQAVDSHFLDLTCGLEPDWWTELEADAAAAEPAESAEFVSRLIGIEEWETALQQAGFASTTPWFEPADEAHQGAFLLAAQADAQVRAPVVQSGEEDLATADDVEGERWLLLADATGFSAELAQHLAAALQERRHEVVVSSTLDGVAGEQVVEHVMPLQGLALQTLANTPDALLALQQQRCVSTVELVQALDACGQSPRLWLVTGGAMTVAEAGAEALHLPEQAPLWGLGRVLMNEHPELQCTLIDLQQAFSAAQAAALLLQECLHHDGETEIVLGAERQVLRMCKTTLREPAAQAAQPPAVALDFSTPGPLKHLYWCTLPQQSLADDEIEIRPQAAGLNFRDVMYAMGLLSDEAVENGFAGPTLGMELAGTVVRRGASVHDFQPGDAVIGFAPACFSTRVITRTTAVAHKPAHWTDEEAATIPTTFFTVYYALHHLAQLEPGERVLIHGASGGVGLAAIQFARYRGAEVFATAGTDEKRDFVRLMGADHVMDSRSLDFAEEVLRLTDGQGVDIILNSISGEAINRNLAILRPFGRFLELGKRDFYENSRIGLKPFRNNISYFGIDADQLLIERPALAGRLFREMMALFEEGVLRPLPHRVFSAHRIQEAFRYMQQSRQIGKVIVSFNAAPPVAELAPEPARTLQLETNGSYLVTGGLSGFGLRTAQWLADKGAGTLVLLSRRGVVTEDAQPTVAALQQQGVNVVVRACDVADYQALEQVFTEVRETLPPLKGVVHAAMVLDDGLVRNLDAERFRAVLAPKMLGAWHLHQLTADLPLDLFVLYSSVTTYLGNPGQANYVAANQYLESLAALRRSQGLPAVFGAWGALDDTGYLARNHAIKDALQARLGGQPLRSEQALAVLEQLVLSEKTGAAVIDMDWATVQRMTPAAKSPKYAELRRLNKGADEGEQGEDIAALIAGLSEAEVQELVAELLMAEVGEILRLPRERLSADKSVFDLGMDSLMGMELVLAIEERFGVKLPVMALTEGATVSRIAARITAQLLAQDGAAASNEQAARKQAVETVVRQHGSDLSDEELERLAASLEQPEGERDEHD
ncbi:MAG: SDR family NAD(P)-dependent oxidoreductase [Thiolinea sp.]